MERFETPEKMLHDCWRLLVRATADKKDPMRTPVIGTMDAGRSYVRMVVLRKVDIQHRLLDCFTDRRSDKVEQLEKHPRLSWLFWNPKKKVQIRAAGKVELIHGDEGAAQIWNQLPAAGRKSYASTQPPGTPINYCTEGLPEVWENDPGKEETDYAFDNFMIIRCTVEEMDLLHLHAEGHQRTSFKHESHSSGAWRGGWVIP